MTVIRVMPLADGVDMRGSWQVTVDGERESNHIKKSAAKDVAYTEADDGDSFVIHGTDGEVLRERTVNKG